MNYAIDADITRAATLDARFYADTSAWEACRSRIFARSWQWLGDTHDVREPESLSPRDLLPGFVDEPLLLSRDKSGELRCLSNVCTHRGNILVKSACRSAEIRCGYHSRRFALDGRMTFMPEFAAAKDFPRAADDLASPAFAEWRGQAFANLDRDALLPPVFAAIDAQLGSLPVADFLPDPASSQDFEVAAHWALYVENYLEGFHIPYVHGGLNAVIDYGSYRTECMPGAVLQIGHARTGEPAFDRADEGKPVAALYWWLFPNLMLNFYPWGLSVNRVVPLALTRTRVEFRSYVWKPELRTRGAGSGLDRVESEDEAVVEAVQRGVRSRLYPGGRYSPTRESGVHHFHRLLVAALGEHA
ncbi:MAG: aromatic ring-hydroxylating dioxygenase subunit alpha [Burkholderiales bacterium]|nr:aromatic ring-hydroxylating dioxygenase subunit alpha [Burkholderiales bacterium]